MRGLHPVMTSLFISKAFDFQCQIIYFTGPMSAQLDYYYYYYYYY